MLILCVVQRKNVRFKNGTIFFTDQGKGRAVVLLHGMLGSADNWKEISANLSKSYRVISIDLPGHGSSECFGYAHSMELMAKSVKAVMDGLKLKRYVFVGHSMGGYVALAFAEIFPDNLRGLCLFHTTSYADTPERRSDRDRAINLIRQNRRVYTSSTIKNLFAGKNLKYLKEEIAFANSIAAKSSKQGMVAALLGMRDRPGRDIVLGLVDYPIMTVIGEQDTLVPASQLLEQSKLIRHPFVLYLEHDGHMGFLESPRQCLRSMRKFLRHCF
jgi:pimeloyl-ACP methyl ester carboxylesterase